MNELIINQLELENPIANCYSGIKFDWTQSTNLCGKFLVDIRIDTVVDSEGNRVTSPGILSAVDTFNNVVRTEVAVNGQNTVYTVAGNLTRSFIGYTLDFSVTLTNCYPDKEQTRVKVEMVD